MTTPSPLRTFLALAALLAVAGAGPRLVRAADVPPPVPAKKTPRTYT